jgi:hypothetical protein
MTLAVATRPDAPVPSAAAGDPPAGDPPAGDLPAGDLPAGDLPASDLMELLRGNVRRRPFVDPFLAGGLREWLEDGVSTWCADRTPESPMVVSSRALAAALGPPPAASRGGEQQGRHPTIPIARGALVEIIFAQLLTAGPALDPVGDALEALAIDSARADLGRFIGSLPAGDREELLADVRSHARILWSRWSRLPAHWLPRTNDRIRIPLAGGRLVLACSVDLVIGTPCRDRAPVCLVDLVAGAPRVEHRAELQFAALLETLRSGAPPFRVGSHYTGNGATRTEDVTEEYLAVAVQRTIDGIAASCRAGRTDRDRYPQ